MRAWVVILTLKSQGYQPTRSLAAGRFLLRRVACWCLRSFRWAACFMCHEMLNKLIDTRPSFSLSTQHPQLSQYVWNLK